MATGKKRFLTLLAVSAALVAGLYLLTGKRFSFFVPFAFAHCDTMGGPVIKAAMKALETGRAEHVLIWVQKKDEAEITEAFRRTLAVRKLNPDAKELADRYFFETLVRVHRAGEGAPYTGLKPAGTEEPPIAAADKALETGQVDALAEHMSGHVAEGIRAQFEKMMAKKKDMDKSVEAGREFVAAYVTFIHYVEKLYIDAAGTAGHAAEGAKSDPGHIH